MILQVREIYVGQPGMADPRHSPAVLILTVVAVVVIIKHGVATAALVIEVIAAITGVKVEVAVVAGGEVAAPVPLEAIDSSRGVCPTARKT